MYGIYIEAQSFNYRICIGDELSYSAAHMY